MKQGKLIVFEGLDGSGKQTQSDLFYCRLEAEGYRVRKVSYPRYDNPSSALVKMYLAGEFGEDPNAVSPYISSTFFAVDRYASYKQDYEAFYQSGGIVIADRYTTSNLLHQASKIADEHQRHRFISWLTDLEYNIYGIPQPDMVFFLNMGLKETSALTKHRLNKMDGLTKKDIHEASTTHLQKAYDVAASLIAECGWLRIDCVREGSILAPEVIADIIYEEFIKRTIE